MAGSNIFMQLITGAGPIMGEGLLEGWEGSIELREFEWGMHALKDPKPKASGLLGAAASAAAAAVGVGKPISIKMEPLRFTKRFDVASAQIHTCLDNHLPVLSCTITVLNIMQGGRSIHQPGFVLMATNGYFASSKLSVERDGEGVELLETVVLNFKNIKLVYNKRLGKDNLPTAPFFHPIAI